MRILVYIEPYPIRNSFTHFKDIAARFLDLLIPSDPKADIRMYANKATFDALPVEKSKVVSQRLLRSTEKEEVLFKEHLCEWEIEGMKSWMELMEGVGVADDYLGILHRLWHLFPFDVIVHWGENGAISRFVKDRPITRVAMELGCTRAPFIPSVIMDIYGTNGAGLVPKLSVAEIGEIVGSKLISRHEAIYGFSHDIEAKPYEEQFYPLKNELAHRLYKADRVAFLPLQLHDDANLVRFSKYNSVEAVVLDVVPKLVEVGYTVIVKPHPASSHRVGSDFANKLARASIRPWSSSVIWCEQNYSTSQLMALSDLVVTVNSSVGFEALYYDKLVVVLGDAVYKPIGLFPTLDQVISEEYNPGAYSLGVAQLRTFMLSSYLIPENIEKQFCSFVNRICLLDHLRSVANGNPYAVASGLSAAVAPAQRNLAKQCLVKGYSLPGANEFKSPSVTPAATRGSKTQHEYSIETVGMVRRLFVYSGSAGSEDFVEWLHESIKTSEGIEKLIRHSNLVHESYYLKRYPDVAQAAEDATNHFVRHGFIEGRSPRRGIESLSAEMLLNIFLSVVDVALSSATLFPLSPQDAALRQKQLAVIKKKLGKRGHSLCVIAHMYYRDLVPELLAVLKNISEGFDLLVTLPNWGTDEIEAMVRKEYPGAMFYKTPNRGRDIGPFIDLLPLVVQQNYDALLKIQTKRGYFRGGKLIPELGEMWRDESYRLLVGSDALVEEILSVIRGNQAPALIGPAPYYVSLEKYPYHDKGILANLVLKGAVSPSEGGFFAGTMFWVRPACFTPLVDAGLSIESFELEDGANDGAIAHLLERVFGQLAVTQGGVAGVHEDGSLRLDPGSNENIDEYLTLKSRARTLRQPKARGALAW